MTVYLDASVLVGLFTVDTFSLRATAFLKTQKPILIVSDFAAAEFASEVARLVRTREVTSSGRTVCSPKWTGGSRNRQNVSPQRYLVVEGR